LKIYKLFELYKLTDKIILSGSTRDFTQSLKESISNILLCLWCIITLPWWIAKLILSPIKLIPKLVIFNGSVEDNLSVENNIRESLEILREMEEIEND